MTHMTRMTRMTHMPTGAAMAHAFAPSATNSLAGQVSLSIERLRLSLPAGMATPAWIAGFSAALPKAIESRLTEVMSGAASPPAAPRAPVTGEQAADWVAGQVAALAVDRIAEAASGDSGRSR